MADVIPEFAGDVLTSPYALALAGDDFGHLVRSTPSVVVRPTSASDVAAAVSFARSERLRVAARGSGHSVYGRSQSAGGMVVDLGGLSSVSVSPDRAVASAGAGATWRSVVSAALAAGLTPPVLTNYLDLSVGGTLAVGGVGGTSHRYGLQTDSVLSLDVVTGTGELVRCSPTSNASLFDAVRGGLGQFGVVVRASLSLVPAPSVVRLYSVSCGSLASLAAVGMRLLAEGVVDDLQGSVSPSGEVVLEAGVFDGTLSLGVPAVEVPYAAYVSAFDQYTSLLRSSGTWSAPHPWLLTFLPASSAVAVASSIVSSLVPSDLGEHGRVLFYPVSTSAFGTPLVRMPPEPVAFVFNLVRFGPASLVEQNASLYKVIRAAGGVLYPVSALPFGPLDWRAHFGPSWAALDRAKAAYDPDHVLTPGYPLFDV